MRRRRGTGLVDRLVRANTIIFAASVTGALALAAIAYLCVLLVASTGTAVSQ